MSKIVDILNMSIAMDIFIGIFVSAFIKKAKKINSPYQMTDRGYLHLAGDGVVRKWNSAAYHYTPAIHSGAFIGCFYMTLKQRSLFLEFLYGLGQPAS